MWTHRINVSLLIIIQLILMAVNVPSQNLQIGVNTEPESALNSSSSIGDNEEEEDINASKLKSEIFKIVLGEGYDNQIRPPGIDGHGPTIVSISMLIRSIENLDDVAMQYRVQMTYRQEWIDPRVKYSHINNNITYMSLVKADQIWTPDLFFANEKEGYLHELMVPNVFTRIYPDGLILQSYRITLTLSCPMDLRTYPLDQQYCPIRMATYGWTKRDVLLKWRDLKGIEMPGDFQMPRFKLKSYKRENCESVTSAGAYACIQLQLHFIRQFGYYFIQMYVPTSFIVLVSWLSFWLEPSATEARVSLGVTTILTVVTETYGINQSVPPASYIKALDVWTTACELFVFSALLQFSFVNYVSRFQWQKQLKYLVQIHEEPEEARRKKELSIMERYQRKAKRIDMIAKILFPSTFLVFNIVYWTTYLTIVKRKAS